jgi:hypothetical protein
VKCDLIVRPEDLLAKLAQGSEIWNAWRQTNQSAMDLRGAKLRKARLSRADLSGINLTEVDFDGALLFGANLRNANLQGARFYVANLSGADIRRADLTKSYLRGADLRHADLRNADLRDADLRGANLRYADLRNANVRGADLRDADLRDTDLRGVDLGYVMKTGAALEGAKTVDDEPRVPQARNTSEPGGAPVESETGEILGDSVIARLRTALVEPGDMQERELRKAYELCERYTTFREENPKRRWPLLTMVAFIEATKPYLMFRAWAAVHDKPFHGISALCESLHDLFGKEFFEGRKLTKPVAKGLSFGDCLHEMGVITEEQLRDARALRTEIETAVGVRLFLGTILVRNSLITLGEYYQALATHYGIAFTGLDDRTVAAIAEEWGEFSDLHTRTSMNRAITDDL